eukprot:2545019-Prymnesium_polylepis.1
MARVEPLGSEAQARRSMRGSVQACQAADQLRPHARLSRCSTGPDLKAVLADEMMPVELLGGEVQSGRSSRRSSGAISRATPTVPSLRRCSTGDLPCGDESVQVEQSSEVGQDQQSLELLISAAFRGENTDVVKAALECLVNHGITTQDEWLEVASAGQAHGVLADLRRSGIFNTLMLVRLERVLNELSRPLPRCNKSQQDVPMRSWPLASVMWRHVFSDPSKMWEWCGTAVYSRAWLERLTFIQGGEKLRDTLYGSTNDTVIVVALYISFLLSVPTQIGSFGAGNAPLDLLLNAACINGAFIAVVFVLLKLVSKEIYSIVSDENLEEFVRATPDLDLFARRMYVVMNYLIAVVFTAKLCEPFRHSDPQKAGWFFRIRSDGDEMPSWLLWLGVAMNILIWVVAVNILVWQSGAVSRLALHSGRLRLAVGGARRSDTRVVCHRSEASVRRRGIEPTDASD